MEWLADHDWLAVELVGAQSVGSTAPTNNLDY